MNSNKKDLVVIDSCIFEEIILEQPLTEKCQKAIQEIKDSKKQICITSIIIYEIIKRINEEVDKRNPESSFSLRASAKGYRKKDLERFLNAFKELAKDSKLIWAGGKNFKDILDNCDLRIETNDRFNLAIAISNYCSEFITKDSGIKDEKRKIKEISKNRLMISFIK